MTKNDVKVVTVLVVATVVLALSVYILVGTLAPEYKKTVYTNPLTEELLSDPTVLAISCTDRKGTHHVLACSVNADVKGTWVIYEFVDGEVRGGTPSNFAFNSWEIRVGSSVSENIIVEFYPLGSTVPIRKGYTMDTAYMRQGVRNFAGVDV